MSTDLRTSTSLDIATYDEILTESCSTIIRLRLELQETAQEREELRAEIECLKSALRQTVEELALYSVKGMNEIEEHFDEEGEDEEVETCPHCGAPCSGYSRWGGRCGMPCI